jgi:hypothetical protein
MATLTGVVRCVRVADEACLTTVNQLGTPYRETFILWWDGLATPAYPAARTRISRSEWVSLLRQSLVSNIPVTITHGSTSSLVDNVQLGQ